MKGKDAMNGQFSRLIFVVVLAAALLAGCAAPQATAAAPTAPPTPPTAVPIQPSNTSIPPAAAKPTATLAPAPSTATPRPPAATPAPSVKILLQPCVDPNVKDVWLEFTIPQSEVLTGDVLSQDLDAGVLEIVLPDGSVKTFDQVPPAPKDAAAAQTAVCLPEGVGINNLNGKPGSYFLSEYTFENYSSTPHGPQIRVPLETVMQGFAAGSYQLWWHATGASSERMIIAWDGKAATSAKAVPN